MQAYLESKLGALVEDSETRPLNSGRARDKEAESSPLNLITPSNPKVEGWSLLPHISTNSSY